MSEAKPAAAAKPAPVLPPNIVDGVLMPES